MTGRILSAVLGVLILAALIVRATGPGSAWAPHPNASAPPVAVRPSRASVPPPARSFPSRNLFQYADERVTSRVPSPPPAVRPPPVRAETETAPAAPAVRVAGLIRRAGQLKAALVVDGEVTVAGRGERAGDYTVLDVDDEAGVRVRGPGGDEMVLPAPPF